MCHKLGMTHKQPQPLLPAGMWFQAVASQLPHSTARCQFQGLTSLGLLAAQRPPLQELGFLPGLDFSELAGHRAP